MLRGIAAVAVAGMVAAVAGMVVAVGAVAGVVDAAVAGVAVGVAGVVGGASASVFHRFIMRRLPITTHLLHIIHHTLRMAIHTDIPTTADHTDIPPTAE
jgi:hypothetical protein